MPKSLLMYLYNTCNTMWHMAGGGMHKGFWWESWRQTPLAVSMHKWDNTRTDLNQTGQQGIDWIRLTQDRDRWWGLVHNEMKLLVL